MKKKKTPSMRDLDRGEILCFLVDFYPEPVTFRMILKDMDESGHELMKGELEFYLSMMEEAGLIHVERSEKRLGEEQKILVIKATLAGINERDRRAKGDLRVEI